MPFALFRRHEKKLMAIFAILAMGGFILSDTLPALFRNRETGPRADTPIAKLYGKTIRYSDLDELGTQRRLANAFMANLKGPAYSRYFGDTTIRDLVDAYILQHKADELGLKPTTELAKQFLQDSTDGQMDAAMFEAVLAPFRSNQNITGEIMLQAIANQVRLRIVALLPGRPEITPLDVLQAYRDRYETVSAKAVAFPAEDYLKDVREPSPQEIQAYYDRYKNTLPDPTRDTPGFKIPRLVQLNYITIDGEALARDFRAQLTTEELKNYYEKRKGEFTLPPLMNLPTDLFEGDPSLTPPPAKAEDAAPEVQTDDGPRYVPFAQLRAQLEADWVQERVREVVDRKFEAVSDPMRDFAEQYENAVADAKEERSRGGTGAKPLPSPPDLKPILDRAGLKLEVTEPLSREQAEQKLGALAKSHIGLSRLSESKSFLDEFFGDRQTLFEPLELSSDTGLYFLAWKVSDTPARVPPLDEVRAQVVHAWKIEQARALALKDAEALAKRVRDKGGQLTPELAGTRPILITGQVTKLEATPLFVPGQFAPRTPRPTDLPQFSEPGDELRRALFDLGPNEVAVAPNAPKTVYYVLAYHDRKPVQFTELYGSQFGPYMSLQNEVRLEAQERTIEEWMAQLRAEAGLPADWSPPDEEQEWKPSRRNA
jgi:hypothetical protein